MGTHVEAPASRQDQPAALAHLDDVLELARREEPAWPEGIAELRRSGALLNVGEDEEEAGNEGEPNPDDDHSQDGNQDGDGETESFTDFDLDSLDGDARRVAEAAQKRMQADYTRKTQQASREVEEARQYQAIVEGLEDPERRPEILRILGVQEGDDEEWLDEEGFDGPDPNQRIDQLEQALAGREEEEVRRAEEDRIDNEIAEQIEAVEEDRGRPFTKRQIRHLYRIAEELPGVDGSPDVKAAIAEYEGLISEEQGEWIQSKKAPRRMPNGKTASRQVDLSKETPEERIKRMTAAAEAAAGTGE